MKTFTKALRRRGNLRIVRCYNKRKGVWFEIQKKFFIFNIWKTYMGGNDFLSFEASGCTYSEIKEIAYYWFDWKLDAS